MEVYTKFCTHPSPITKYKITEIDDDKVTFFFNDLANNKKKNYITTPVEKFISQIMLHLPPKKFKMVKRYGFYSRYIFHKLKKAIESFKKIFLYQNIHFIRGIFT